MSKNLCPFLKKKCIEHDCAMYTKLSGINKNSGMSIDEWGCSLAWLPILMVENAQQTKMAGSAIESFRNEMVAQNESLLQHAPPPQLLRGER